MYHTLFNYAVLHVGLLLYTHVKPAKSLFVYLCGLKGVSLCDGCMQPLPHIFLRGGIPRIYSPDYLHVLTGVTQTTK